MRATRSTAGASTRCPATPTAISASTATACSSPATRSSRRSRPPSVSIAESRPDPLGDYLGSLTDIAELDPRVSYGGHGATVDEPAERAHAIVAHHDERLDQTEAALDARARSGYEISHVVFGRELPPIQRRFAVAETLSHLERLVVLGRAARSEDDRMVTYTAPQPGGRETA